MIEMIIIMVSAIKHGAHICNVRGVPTHVLVVRRSSFEHRRHIGYGADVPISDILIEIMSTLKHGSHIGDILHVPIANSLIETFSSFKHGTHVSYITCIPI